MVEGLQKNTRLSDWEKLDVRDFSKGKQEKIFHHFNDKNWELQIIYW